MDYCKSQFGHKWQKRFSKDLVEVLEGLGYQPNVNVKLQLSEEVISKTIAGTFTAENRQTKLAFNNAIKESKSNRVVPQKISIAEALAGIRQFEELLNTNSSYGQLSTSDYSAALKKLSGTIASGTSAVAIDALTHELGKIMAEIGDRHASIKNEAFLSERHETYNLKLPFGIAVLDGKIIGLKQNLKKDNYNYYFSSYPYVKNIDGIAVV